MEDPSPVCCGGHYSCAFADITATVLNDGTPAAIRCDCQNGCDWTASIVSKDSSSGKASSIFMTGGSNRGTTVIETTNEHDVFCTGK